MCARSPISPSPPLTRINNHFDMHTVLLQKSITLASLNMCVVLNILSFWSVSKDLCYVPYLPPPPSPKINYQFDMYATLSSTCMHVLYAHISCKNQYNLLTLHMHTSLPRIITMCVLLPTSLSRDPLKEIDWKSFRFVYFFSLSISLDKHFLL